MLRLLSGHDQQMLLQQQQQQQHQMQVQQQQMQVQQQQFSQQQSFQQSAAFQRKLLMLNLENKIVSKKILVTFSKQTMKMFDISKKYWSFFSCHIRKFTREI
jgi:N-acetyl-gamma-glutamylphosphate reductase